ncbi:hypothetical protein XM38_003480 [Halomicronema hongdechloris C2206]|uniref:Uncharacterized protein n=1 Tax=Halomicronema hongdechloris C2206 TaxID=1641165 RepID=A0A1Z3HGL1_9CYAN|nr:hypothetical protein [Halomicronema hongdechloris]ASC69421.1 hypothetical protein XM38_003480 [Halomicronema hongdechloris C2206]
MSDNNNNDEDVVLRGVITALRPQRGPHPHLKWVAVLDVDAVMAGQFSGQTFAFHIHSPTKSGIAVGGQYVIRMTRTPAGEYLLRAIEPWKDGPPSQLENGT